MNFLLREQCSRLFLEILPTFCHDGSVHFPEWTAIFPKIIIPNQISWICYFIMLLNYYIFMLYPIVRNISPLRTLEIREIIKNNDRFGCSDLKDCSVYYCNILYVEISVLNIGSYAAHGWENGLKTTSDLNSATQNSSFRITGRQSETPVASKYERTCWKQPQIWIRRPKKYYIYSIAGFSEFVQEVS